MCFWACDESYPVRGMLFQRGGPRPYPESCGPGLVGSGMPEAALGMGSLGASFARDTWGHFTPFLPHLAALKSHS